MGQVTKIEWTERTWNPLRGCSKVSPGCNKQSYPMSLADRCRRGPPMDRPTYRLSTYDPGATPDDPCGWVVRHSGLALWRLRNAIRTARAEGYDDDFSILVEGEADGGDQDGNPVVRLDA